MSAHSTHQPAQQTPQERLAGAGDWQCDRQRSLVIASLLRCPDKASRPRGRAK